MTTPITIVLKPSRSERIPSSDDKRPLPTINRARPANKGRTGSTTLRSLTDVSFVSRPTTSESRSGTPGPQATLGARLNVYRVASTRLWMATRDFTDSDGEMPLMPTDST
jgi:hypothetical protein